ncbi:PBECR2 nuclease fold domain-containing protein [Xanthobacter sp. VTT E-85241]|uniref:PBECR2 nuclease fold domain-containing protein n=1 Tax=Roseixanthobacter finlandensis TaxID=3119922 RepID=UPI0037268792
MSVAARILGYVRAPDARAPGARPGPGAPAARRADLHRPARFAAGEFKVPFQPAIDFHRQKVRLPTRTWRDLDGHAHDRAFVVAGATKDALLADLHGAVDDVIAKGMRLEEFAARFEEIVAKHGWTGWTGEGTERGRAWRARVIYDTNLRTAYAAGRYRQMTHPDVVKVRPFWEYFHGDTRTPLRPRPQHVAWHGKVLRWDDPFWQTHYPPNGWLCSCGVRTVSRRELTRMGKSGPDEAPAMETRAVKDPLTGAIHHVPRGIDFGWDHAPGRSWAEGLMPRQMDLPLPSPRKPGANTKVTTLPRAAPELPPVVPPAPDLGPVLLSEAMPVGGSRIPLPPLADIAQPVAAKIMEAGKPLTDYVDAFLGAFGARRDGGAVLFRDVSGGTVIISEDLFKTAGGAWKLAKGMRAPHVLRLAEAIRDPDEIWVDWVADHMRGGTRLVRRYLRYDPEGSGYSVFEWTDRGWSGVTAFPPKPTQSGEAQARYLDQYRTGEVLYRRKK